MTECIQLNSLAPGGYIWYNAETKISWELQFLWYQL